MIKKKYTYCDMKSFVESRGGKLLNKGNLPDRFLTKNKLKIKCKCGNVFEKDFYKLKIGGWCPNCSSGLSERIVRAYFEQIFGLKFKKTRPKWLIGANGRVLELDGYNSFLNLAFEYNGEQHYSLGKFNWFADEKTFKIRRQNDLIKWTLCRKNKVNLIIIPPLYVEIKLEELQNYIVENCKLLKINIPNENIKVDLSKIYSLSDRDKLNELKRKIKRKKIKCLSSIYLSANSKMKFRCLKCKCEWRAVSNVVKNGVNGCPNCGSAKSIKKRSYSYSFVKKYIEKKDGVLLSETYKNCKEKLKIKCNKCNNVWDSSFDNIKSGYWCAKCANCKRLSIGQMIEFARERNGKCLSGNYINAHSKLKWQCEKGHVWESSYFAIRKTKNWCPFCRETDGRCNNRDGNL